MKKQSTHPVQAHFLRGTFYLFLLLADCAIPFALADRNSAGGAAQGTMLSGVHSKAPGGCIVVNGDFETGSLPPWVNTGDTSFTSVNNSNPHSGSFSLQIGPAFIDGFIDQLLPTVAGQGYDVSFWLENDDDSGNNRFGASFGDVTLVPEATQSVFGYTLFTFTNVVPGANADLHFIFFNEPTYFYLDDVCVTATSGGGTPTPTPTVTPTPTATETPGGCIVVNGDFETGSLPPWVNTEDTSFTSVNNSNPHSGSFSLQIGPAFIDGFIDQLLPTVAGQGYDVSFWLENDDDSENNRFGASFGDVTLVPEATQSVFGYTLFTFTNVVPGANADLHFIFFNEPTYFYLDDVCVTATSGGGTPTPTPTATFSPTPTATTTPTSTPTATGTVSPTPTATARPSPTPRLAPTPRPRPTPPPRP